MTIDQDQTLVLPVEVLEFLQAAGAGDVSETQVLKGGVISLTRRLTTTTGERFVLKQSAQLPDDDVYAREAESLQVLKEAGLYTPEVLVVGSDFLLLHDLGGAPPAPLAWETLGRAIARLHERTNPRFGFDHDNYLGRLPQRNGWMDDGHEFFIQNRILRYLEVPLCQQTLTAEDRSKLERLTARFSQLIPAQPASLLHGDLWMGNILFDYNGLGAVLDPAVYYGWAEAELSMVRQYPGVPQTFFDAYIEAHPLENGWWERLELLFIREILSVIAHFGDRGDALNQLRSIMDKFA